MTFYIKDVVVHPINPPSLWARIAILRPIMSVFVFILFYGGLVTIVVIGVIQNSNNDNSGLNSLDSFTRFVLLLLLVILHRLIAHSINKERLAVRMGQRRSRYVIEDDYSFTLRTYAPELAVLVPNDVFEELFRDADVIKADTAIRSASHEDCEGLQNKLTKSLEVLNLAQGLFLRREVATPEALDALQGQRSLIARIVNHRSHDLIDKMESEEQLLRRLIAETEVVLGHTE